MVNDIIVGIAKALNIFTDTKVYIDNVEQKLETPCFLVRAVDTGRKKRLAKHYKIIPGFAVTYMTEGADDLCAVGSVIPIALDSITAGTTTLYATNLDINIDYSEHTLTCTVNYPYTVKVVEEAGPLMRNMRLAERLKK